MDNLLERTSPMKPDKTPDNHKPQLPANRLTLNLGLTADDQPSLTASDMARDKAKPVAPTSPAMTGMQGNSLRFERRRADRHAVTGRVTSLQYSGPAGPDQHRKIASLQLVNISDTGACVLAQDAVDLNAAMTIFFPPHGPDRGFDAIGHVVRCLKRDDNHHELGIRFDCKPAA